MKIRTLIPLLALSACLCSCKAISSFFHDGGAVVAKVGDHKLYERELKEYIPVGISPEDSTKLALQYINSWAEDMVYLDVAESELSKTEKDVTKELEDYRRSLLKFRYEQQYVSQRLDTTITDKQIQEYYDTHKGNFVLDYPIMKVLYVSVTTDNPDIKAVRKSLQRRTIKDMDVPDSLIMSLAVRYVDYGGNWVSASTLALEFGTDYITMLSKNKDGFIEIEDESKGAIGMARIYQMMLPGQNGPLEFYRDRIKDAILSSRKQTLLNSLEQDLLNRARTEEKFEIY